MPTYSEVGHSLRLARNKQQLRQSIAAKMLGCSGSYLCEIERGRKRPSLRLAARIEKVFGIPALDWIKAEARSEALEMADHHRSAAWAAGTEEHQLAARRLCAGCQVCPFCKRPWVAVEAEIDLDSGLPAGRLRCMGGCVITVRAQDRPSGTLRGMAP